MAVTGYDNNRAAKGQAINLAVNDAIANGQESNVKYIYQKFVYYSTLAEMMQSSSVEDIKEVLDSKELNNITKDIEKLMNSIKLKEALK